MKRLLFAFFLTVIMFTLSGCENAILDGLKDCVNIFLDDSDDDDYVVVFDSEVDEKALQMGELVYKAISSKDASGLKSIMSTHTKNTHNIDNEIQTLFNSIKGVPVSCDDICLTGSEGSSDEEKGDYYNSYSVKIDNIRTDQGSTYCIYVEGIYNYFYHPDEVGINEILLDCTDDYNYESDIVVVGNADG